MFYMGYEITPKMKYTGLTSEDISVLYACYYLAFYKSSIRKTAKIHGYAPTTLWRRIHTTCKDISPTLYEDVKKQLKENKRKRRR